MGDGKEEIFGGGTQGACEIFCCLVTQLCSNSFATPWTTTHKAPLSMEFPRQGYWSELPFPSPGDLPDRETEPVCPALAGRFFTSEPPWKL